MKLKEIEGMLQTYPNRTFLWYKEFLLLIKEENTIVKDIQIKINHQDLLAISMTRRKTTKKSGRTTMGFDELISYLENNKIDEDISYVAIYGNKKLGILYFISHREVIGGIIVDRGEK